MPSHAAVQLGRESRLPNFQHDGIALAVPKSSELGHHVTANERVDDTGHFIRAILRSVDDHVPDTVLPQPFDRIERPETRALRPGDLRTTAA